MTMHSRRTFLFESGGGLGGIALSAMLASNGELTAQDATDSRISGSSNRDAGLHQPAKAKRVVQFFMSGAASHIDLFDYKQELVKRDGAPQFVGWQATRVPAKQ